MEQNADNFAKPFSVLCVHVLVGCKPDTCDSAKTLAEPSMPPAWFRLFVIELFHRSVPCIQMILLLLPVDATCGGVPLNGAAVKYDNCKDLASRCGFRLSYNRSLDGEDATA